MTQVQTIQHEKNERVLSSDDTSVIPNLTSDNSLLTKHPGQPSDRRQSPPITSDAYSCMVSQLLPAVKSFGPGSASGWDGLRPQHLQDMVQMSSPTGLPVVLCDFVNLFLAGGILQAVRHAFFGATLHALKKKDGGLRPIAVWLYLRRLASKVANRWATAELLSTLAPHQLGVGVRLGAKPLFMRLAPLLLRPPHSMLL